MNCLFNIATIALTCWITCDDPICYTSASTTCFEFDEESSFITHRPMGSPCLTFQNETKLGQCFMDTCVTDPYSLTVSLDYYTCHPPRTDYADVLSYIYTDNFVAPAVASCDYFPVFESSYAYCPEDWERFANDWGPIRGRPPLGTCETRDFSFTMKKLGYVKCKGDWWTSDQNGCEDEEEQKETIAPLSF